jgi:hypothetical protein
VTGVAVDVVAAVELGDEVEAATALDLVAVVPDECLIRYPAGLRMAATPRMATARRIPVVLR